MKGVILHGGSGTRLRPLTYTDVKQLLPLAGKPVSEYALLNLMEIGINKVNIIVGEIGEKEVREYYGDGSKWGIEISYTYQGKPLGIAHAIGMTRDFVGNEDFVVILGDNYFQGGLKELQAKFKDKKYDSLIALTKVRNPTQFGIAEVEKGSIISLAEKPKNPKSDLAIAGAYFLTPKVFPIIDGLAPSWRNELEITEAFQVMLDRRMKLGYSVISGWWKDTGTVSEFLECNRVVLNKLMDNDTTKENLEMQAGVVLGKNSHVNPGVSIFPPVYIGENTRIEDSQIGPYTSIGSDCVVQCSRISNSVVMDGCIISLDTKRKIVDSLIGPGVTIKADTTNSDEVKLVLGRDSKIEI